MKTGEKIRWKTAIPGLAHSSPVIWENRIYLTTATRPGSDADLKVGLYGDITPVTEREEHEWVVLCLDKGSGRILWQQTAHRGVPKVKRHPKSSHANSTPATDGKHVVAFFGSEGLFCFETSGKLLWQKDLGTLDSAFFMVPSAQWGFASSPVIHDDLVIVQCDVLTNSFVAAYGLKTGREVWRTAREDVPTWSTPTVDTRTGDGQVIVNGFKHIGGYDLRTGKELWKLNGGGDIPVPTPVVANGLVFITSAHGRLAPIYAIRLDAAGDISLRNGETSNAHIAWSTNRHGNYMQTPIAVGDHLYCCHDTGVVTCYKAATGKSLYRERLGGGGSGFTASAVAADQKLYFTSETGDVYVVRAGAMFDVMAKNEMDETCMATPAISEGHLFFRTRQHLVAIGSE